MTSTWEVAASELVMKLALTDGKTKSHKSNLLSQRVFESSGVCRFFSCVNAASLMGMLKSYYASVICFLHRGIHALQHITASSTCFHFSLTYTISCDMCVYI